MKMLACDKESGSVLFIHFIRIQVKKKRKLPVCGLTLVVGRVSRCLWVEPVLHHGLLIHAVHARETHLNTCIKFALKFLS